VTMGASHGNPPMRVSLILICIRSAILAITPNWFLRPVAKGCFAASTGHPTGLRLPHTDQGPMGRQLLRRLQVRFIWVFLSEGPIPSLALKERILPLFKAVKEVLIGRWQQEASAAELWIRYPTLMVTELLQQPQRASSSPLRVLNPELW